MIAEGQITRPQVIYNRNTGGTAVKYQAIAPHQWILDEMKRRCS